MAEKRIPNVVWMITGAIFILRVVLALSFGGLEYSGYNLVDDVQYILEKGIPNLDSYHVAGAEGQIVYPVFPYVNAFLALFTGVPLAIILLTSLSAAFYFPLGYCIGKDFSDARGGYWAGFFLSGVPIAISATLQRGTATAFACCLLLWATYIFLRLEKTPRYIPRFILAIFLLGFSSPLSYVFAIAVFVYYILLKAERQIIPYIHLEAGLFAMLTIIWTNEIIMKRAIVLHGAQTIWQNAPTSIRALSFVSPTFTDVLTLLGPIPIILGLIGLYAIMTTKRYKGQNFLVSMILCAVALVLINAISLEYAIFLIASVCCICCGAGMRMVLAYVKKTKVSAWSKHLSIGLIVMFVLTSVVPGIVGVATSDQMPSDADESAMEWLDHQIKESATVVVPVMQGSYLLANSKHLPVANEEFLLVPDAFTRVKAIDAIFTSRFETEALRFLDSYDVDYIVVSQYARQVYGVSALRYSWDDECFPILYNENNVVIYGVECHLQGDSS